MLSTSQEQAAADEELVVSMAKRVVKRLKEPSTLIVHVDGWSGIGRERVLDHVAAALSQRKEVVSFCSCVRVSFKTYKPDAQEYEIRRKIEEALQMSLVGYVNWEEVFIALNWRPLVVILDDLQNHIDYKTLGIPPLVTDPLGAERPFFKVVYTTTDYKTRYYSTIVYKERMISGAHVHANVGDEFGELPGDVALRMILYEAHSATISTVKDYLPYVIRRDFAFGQEEMTCMMLPMLTLLHGNLFGMLTAESVIQCLFSAILFTSTGFPPYYLRSEILSRPCFGNKECFGNNENSWEAELFLRALSLDLQNRRLMFLDPEDGKLKTPDVLAASASSSSLGIMTQLIQGYLVRRSRRLERVDMEEWSQELTRISFADNWIKEILLPPPSAPSNLPNLSTLILRENPQLEEIPDDVFRYVPNLRILDLSYCGISMLPSTLSFLWNLRMLYLQECRNLQTIETTGLNHLEVLNLDYSPLPTLHKASWCHMRSLKRFSFKNGLISLGELQLSLENVKVFDNFDTDLFSSTPTTDTLQKCNISILYPKEEEEEIRRRKTRDAHLRTSDQFPYKDIHAQVDRHIDIVDQYPIVAAGVDNLQEKCLEINGGEGLWSLYTLSLMFRPQLLSLHNYQHAEAGIWPIPELKTCYIKYCRDIDYAFNSPRNRLHLWNLKHLETLWISSLTKMSAICNYMFEQNMSFLLLKSIHLEYCPNLLVLFPVTIRLPNLEVVEIKFCTRLRKLFTQRTAGEIVLPRLKRLRLCELPKLTSICEEGHLPMLQKLEVRGCWNLKNVPIFPSSNSACSGDDVAGKVVLVVRGEEEWWKNVQGGSKKKDHIDFKMGFASAAPKRIPQRWKRGPRLHRRHFPLSL